MKKTLIALAVLAASGAAMAQSTFTLYGVADVNVERQKGGSSSVVGVGSGGLNGSRWGLRGSEDLGNGLKGVFVLESGYGIDTGNSQQSGRLFGRQAYAGLEGGFGSFRLGRQYTPIGNLADVYGNKLYDVFYLTPTIAGAGPLGLAYRTDNAVTYKTPNLSGLTIEAQYGFQVNGAETNTGTSPKQGRHFGINGMYVNGPITAGLGYIGIEDVNAAIAGDQKRAEILGVAGYDFGFVKVMGQFSQTEVGTAAVDADKKMKIYGLNAAFPFGAATITPGFALVKDISGSSGSVKDDAKFFTLQATYDLSKRTALYSNLTVVQNEAGAALGFNTPVADKDSNAIQFGIRHRF